MLRAHDKQRYAKIAGEIFRLGKGKNLEVTLREQSGYLMRFAKNEIHQNGFREFLKISIRLVQDGKSVRMNPADLSRGSLTRTLEELQALLRCRQGSDGEPALLPKQHYREVRDFDPKASGQSPQLSARALAPRVRQIKSREGEVSGYESAACRHVYLANSRGLEAWHRSTAFRFGLTVRRGNGIGYASDFQVFRNRLDREAVMARALERAQHASRPVRVKPGRYTVLFAPRAMAEFTAPLFEDMNARRVADKNSFFWGKKGKRVFSRELQAEDNVYHPAQTGLPFDGAGLPRKKVVLIDRGVVKNFVNDRKAALDLRQASTGHGAGALQPATAPLNITAAPGDETLATILGRLKQAILIPHIWYHQVVNPNSLLATGLIKGSALVWSRGAWAGGVQHLRYLESIAQALGRVRAASLETQTVKDKEIGASVWPFIAVEDFRII